MLIAAVGHLYTFPYKEYAGANIGVSRGFTASLAHALKLNDFYHDTVHQVSYSTYLLLMGSLETVSHFLALFGASYGVACRFFYLGNVCQSIWCAFVYNLQGKNNLNKLKKTYY